MATLEHGDKSLDTKQSFFSGIQFIPSAHMGHKIIRIWLKILLTGIGKSSPELKTCKLICWILFVKIFKALRWTFHDPYKQAFKVLYFSTNKKRSSCFPAQLSLTLWWHFSVRSKGQSGLFRNRTDLQHWPNVEYFLLLTVVLCVCNFYHSKWTQRITFRRTIPMNYGTGNYGCFMFSPGYPGQSQCVQAGDQHYAGQVKYYYY